MAREVGLPRRNHSDVDRRWCTVGLVAGLLSRAYWFPEDRNEAMSIKRDDLDAGRVDFSEVCGPPDERTSVADQGDAG